MVGDEAPRLLSSCFALGLRIGGGADLCFAFADTVVGRDVTASIPNEENGRTERQDRRSFPGDPETGTANFAHAPRDHDRPAGGRQRDTGSLSYTDAAPARRNCPHRRAR